MSAIVSLTHGKQATIELVVEPTPDSDDYYVKEFAGAMVVELTCPR
jgi:hypothetical protein